MNILMNEAREALLKRRSRLRARGEQGGQQVPQHGAVLSAREHQELRDIDEALARMKQGEFGRCLRCGGAIGRYRLRAVPEARYCLTCSGRAER